MSGFFSRVFSRLVGPFAEVHPGERTKTFLMFCYFLLTISTIYILKPVRSSLFLSEFSADKLRYVNIGEGLFLIAVVWLYSLAARRLSHKVLYPAVLGFLIGTLLLFWFFARRNLPYVSAAFYIWQSAFSAMITTQFWILANDIFRPEEAKRLFGLIISGGSLGGILGGIITNFAVRWLRTEDLLLVVVVILVLCIFLISFLWKCILPKASGAVEVGGGIAAAGTHEALKEKEAKKHPFATASYLALIAGIIVIAKMSSTIVENQFGGVVQMAIQGKDAITAFYGGFYGWQNALSFILQLVITGKLLKRYGVGISLWILPVGLAGLSLVSALSPALFVGIFYKMYDSGMNYSIQQASKEILYLPIPAHLRRRVKPAIDMLGYRGAKTLAGIYMALAAPLLGLSVERIGILVLILMPLWFVITAFIHRKLRVYSEEGL
ncbi:MAG TPA: Npt1/Npt2 family nucleotide transporter [Candidatus Omnitrophota bacterium]|nr:Npt1/Npt2 family nucleotide transporter [Candidatus Omnitrophota bacterium]